jgi:DNA-binding NarL/FixJ family response regulator
VFVAETAARRSPQPVEDVELSESEPTTGGPRGADGPVGVLVVDDSEPFRALLRELVLASPGMTCVEEAASGEAAVDAVKRLSPQMVVMDKRMPGMGGVAAARRIRALDPTIVVVLVSVETPEEQVLEASGADAFLHKQRLSARVLAEAWERASRASGSRA